MNTIGVGGRPSIVARFINNMARIFGIRSTTMTSEKPTTT